MAVIAGFFDKSNYIVQDALEDLLVLPDVEFTAVLSIVDTIQGTTGVTITTTVLSIAGRTEVILPSAILISSIGLDQWRATGTISSTDWDGKATLKLRLTIVDAQGLTQEVDHILTKGL